MSREVVRDLVARGALRVEDGNHGNDRPRPDEFVADGVAFIRAADMTSGVVDFDGAGKITDVALRRIRKGVGLPGDVILSHKGTVGRVAVAPLSAPDFVCSPQTTFWRSLDQSVIDQRYLRYVLVSSDFQRQLGVFGGQTDMAPYVSLTDQRSMEIEVRDITEQRAIAEVLGALDDKIAANDKAARLADECVRAKYEALVGDPVPLASIAVNVRDQVDPRNLAKETPYVGLEHVPRRSMWLSNFETAAKVSSAKASFLAGDVLFGKLRPYFHKVVDAPFDGVASTDILVVRSKRPELRGLVLAAASSDAAIAATTASSEGTRMPRTKWADLAAVELPWPGEEKARAFSSEVVELSAWAAATSKESKALAATRDELLPLLMSGKVRVKDAEKTLEGAL